MGKVKALELVQIELTGLEIKELCDLLENQAYELRKMASNFKEDSMYQHELMNERTWVLYTKHKIERQLHKHEEEN